MNKKRQVICKDCIKKMSYYLQRSYHSPLISTLMAIFGGFLIAGFAAVMMKALSIVWICLILAGLIVFLPTFIVKDPKLYWIGVFIFVVPLNVQKMIGDPSNVNKIMDTIGKAWRIAPAFVIQLSDLPFLILLIIWLLEVLTKKKKVYFPKLNFFALAFIGWSSLSILRAPYPVFGIFELIRQIKIFIIYVYITNNIDSKKVIKTMVFFLLIGAFIQGAMTIGTYYFQSTSYVNQIIYGNSERTIRSNDLINRIYEENSDIMRGTSSLGAGDEVAKYFESILPLMFVFTLTLSGIKNRLFHSTILAIGLLALYFTFSRGGMVGAAVSLMTCLLLAHARALVPRKLFLGILYFGIISLLFLTPKMYDYFTSRPESFKKRFDLYKAGIAMVADNPVFGVGLNNNKVVISKYMPGELYTKNVLAVHNHYLLIATEAGIPALIFLIGFFIAIIKKAIRCSRSGDTYIASLAIWILSTYVAISIHMLVNPLGHDVIQTLLLIYAGLIIAFDRIEGRQIQ